MKKLLLLLLLMAAVLPVFGQLNLDKMPEEQRNKVLLEMAKKAVLEYAPDYYNENPIPAIQDIGIHSGDYPEKKDVRVYRVKYFYDKAKLGLDRNFTSIYVDIWADDGQPYDIRTLYGRKFSLYDWQKEVETAKKAGTTPDLSKKPVYVFRAPDIGFIDIPLSDELRNRIRIFLHYLREDGSPAALREVKLWEEKNMPEYEEKSLWALKKIETDRLYEQRWIEMHEAYDKESQKFRQEIKHQETILNEQLKEQYPVDSTRRRKIREELKPQWDEFYQREILKGQEIERQNKQAYAELEQLRLEIWNKYK